VSAILLPEAVAERYGVPLRTLATWRYHRRGPAYIVVGKHVRYRVADLEAWEAAQRVEPVGVG